MNILLSLVFIVLILVTTGVHLYYVWKKEDYRTLYTQLALVGLTIVLGIIGIWGVTEPSISTIFNELSPFKK